MLSALLPPPMRRPSPWLIALGACTALLPLVLVAARAKGIPIPSTTIVFLAAVVASLLVLGTGLLVGEAAIDSSQGAVWRARVGRIAHVLLAVLWIVTAVVALGSSLLWPAVAAAILHCIAAIIDWRVAADFLETD